MAKVEWTPSYFTIYYLSMDKKIFRLYQHEIAFSLVPQQLVCTKVKNIRESRKRNMILKCLCPHVGCTCIAP